MMSHTLLTPRGEFSLNQYRDKVHEQPAISPDHLRWNLSEDDVAETEVREGDSSLDHRRHNGTSVRR